MTHSDKTVLVFGATGQQGGSVAAALRGAGWPVRALVRRPDSPAARALDALGVDVVPGDLHKPSTLQSAMTGVYGVFSMQPSAGQPGSGISDADEVHLGVAVADAAADQKVSHLVYTSSNAAGAATGIGHFESKTRIETHVRGIPIDTTIVRPATFMEILLEPDFGLPDDRLTFFMRPDQRMQFIAVDDIGALVAAVFADRDTFTGRTVQLAGDSLTGDQLATAFSRSRDRPVSYRRFPDEILRDHDLLRRLADAVDNGPLAGSADLDALRRLHPALLTFDAWLDRSAHQPLARAGSNP